MCRRTSRSVWAAASCSTASASASLSSCDSFHHLYTSLPETIPDRSCGVSAFSFSIHPLLVFHVSVWGFFFCFFFLNPLLCICLCKFLPSPSKQRQNRDQSLLNFSTLYSRVYTTESMTCRRLFFLRMSY